MKGRVVVFGLGRSGLAIAKAAAKFGGTAVVYDQASRDQLSKPELVQEAESVGAEVVLAWDRVFPAPGAPGESVLVVNPAVDMRSPILADALAQGYEVVSEVEFAYRISKAPIVGITGTNGKSTTTVMTYLCLRECGIEAVLCGNIFGSGFPEVPLTEAALNSTPDQILVAEISSFQLEWVKEFRPVSAGITNVWPDHLDRYDSFEQYAATKQRIFAAQQDSDYAVIRANDPVVKIPGAASTLRRFRRQPLTEDRGHRAKVLTFGAMGDHAQIDERNLTVLDKRVKLEDLPFQEPHNFSNASMAALLAFGALDSVRRRHPGSRAAAILAEAESEHARRLGEKSNAYNRRQQESELGNQVLPGCIIEGLKQFKGLAHRMEWVGEKGGVRVINNSMCTNPDAVLKSATSLRGPNHVLIGGKDKDLDFSPLRHYFSSGMHRAYVYGEAKEKLSEQIGTKLVYRTMEDALRAALDAARSGEAVMLAPGCASTDQFRDFRHRGDVFRQLAKEWLES